MILAVVIGSAVLLVVIVSAIGFLASPLDIQG
jgi:hypothetical protein